MSGGNAEERTEKPTPKRLREAREKGQVPRSRELNSTLVMMASALCLWGLGSMLVGDLAEIMRDGLAVERSMAMDPVALVQRFASLVGKGMWVLSPLFLILMVAALVGPASMGGMVFSAKAISFKAEKINPLKGIGRIFSARALMELLKTLAKFSLVAAVSVALLWSLKDELLFLAGEPMHRALGHAGTLFVKAFLTLSSVLILVVLIDVPFQIYQHNKQLKMSMKEIKDESKETEGRPEVKGKIRALQREMSQRRMMERVPEADVVITNPTHYSVALAYDREASGAPRVLAKGADLVALRIREVAGKHGIAVVSAPPLARALYATTEIDEEIPGELYVAVAHILAYVYQLNQARSGNAEEPSLPTDLPVPDEFK
ncbi:flagellar biosynthesis protein FlhB [Thiolapillus brandeum]|uniref:Flagellar biosynthetic protein FlhB n=1 Tax=Thiolapillus brandeum TaxID=1076588 RepID=A0A7U6JIJ9_9GAMM|nr:flagellar biosynthesis protein FlhB [Thiolapillus brandeum]BAO44320.1 flagellar biosynthetic protein FlhB [Thiolapillus brandeum]